jgi:hypothetical protein
MTASSTRQHGSASAPVDKGAEILRTFSSPAARLAAPQLGRLGPMAAKIKRLARNSSLATTTTL